MSNDGDSGAGGSSSPPGPSAGGIADQAKAAIDQFRSVGKWIITSFAAVGTLLLAGVQLTSIGTVSGGRLALAIVGLAVSVAAVLVAVRSVAALLEPHVSAPDSAIDAADDTSTPLGEFFKDHKQVILPPGINTAAELKEKFDRLRSQAQRSPGDESNLRSMLTSYSNIVWWSSYQTAKKNFDRTCSFVMGSAVLIAVGASLYAWAATGPTKASSSDNAAQPSSTPVVEPVPVSAILKLTSIGKDAFKGDLSSICIDAATTKGIPAIAISADSSETTVILIPSHDCPLPARITVPLSEGTVMATAPVSPPRPKPSASKQPIPRSSKQQGST